MSDELDAFLALVGPIPRSALRDVFFQAESAARIIFEAGDLANALEAWNLILEAGRRQHYMVDHHGRDLDANRRLQRARVLDHLDEIDEACAEFVAIADLLRTRGHVREADHVRHSADRLARKIARRDAGKFWQRHTREFNPERQEARRRRWKGIRQWVSEIEQRRRRGG